MTDKTYVVIMDMRKVSCVTSYHDVSKGRVKGKVEKETPVEEIDNRRIFMKSHMIVSTYPVIINFIPFTTRGIDKVNGFYRLYGSDFSHWIII